MAPLPRNSRAIRIAWIFLLAIAAASCSPASEPEVFEIIFEASGSEKALVEYDNPDLKYRSKVVDLPWELTCRVAEQDIVASSNIRISVSRPTDSPARGHIGCELMVNSKTMMRQSSQAATSAKLASYSGPSLSLSS